MRELEVRQVRPELKEMVVEASRALATLDADRLEELALSCQALHCELARGNKRQHHALVRQSREAAGDMAVFARVMEVTRSNLNVMKHLQELREGRLEYSEGQARGWARTESGHGDN